MTTDLDTRLPDLPELERQAEEYERKAHAIRQIIAGVQTLNGEASTILTRRSFDAHRTSFEIAPPDPNGFRGPKAVLLVMAEAPDRAWKVVDVKREMLRRGWAPTPKAVEASVKRLREEGKLSPAAYGHYRLAPAGLEQVAALTDVQSRGGDAQ
jgi:hypothetical protein